MTEDDLLLIGARAMHDGTAADRGPWDARKFAAKRAYLDAMRRALAAYHEAGFVLVPVEPDEAMKEAGLEAAALEGETAQVYRAMIHAATGDAP